MQTGSSDIAFPQHLVRPCSEPIPGTASMGGDSGEPSRQRGQLKLFPHLFSSAQLLWFGVSSNPHPFFRKREIFLIITVSLIFSCDQDQCTQPFEATLWIWLAIRSLCLYADCFVAVHLRFLEPGPVSSQPRTSRPFGSVSHQVELSLEGKKFFNFSAQPLVRSFLCRACSSTVECPASVPCPC